MLGRLPPSLVSGSFIDACPVQRWHDPLGVSAGCQCCTGRRKRGIPTHIMSLSHAPSHDPPLSVHPNKGGETRLVLVLPRHSYSLPLSLSTHMLLGMCWCGGRARMGVTSHFLFLFRMPNSITNLSHGTEVIGLGAIYAPQPPQSLYKGKVLTSKQNTIGSAGHDRADHFSKTKW